MKVMRTLGIVTLALTSILVARFHSVFVSLVIRLLTTEDVLMVAKVEMITSPKRIIVTEGVNRSHNYNAALRPGLGTCCSTSQ
jgi:Na+-transporting NADH:ubiquinone oxidoreductase subunit NqrD